MYMTQLHTKFSSTPVKLNGKYQWWMRNSNFCITLGRFIAVNILNWVESKRLSVLRLVVTFWEFQQNLFRGSSDILLKLHINEHKRRLKIIAFMFRGCDK